LKRPVPPGERGAALLAVLLLVAVTGAIAATALERIRISTSLAINSAALDQARGFAMGIETLLALRVDDLVAISPEMTTLAGGWNGEPRRLPMPGGALAHATLRDGGNCFNINSLVDGGAAQAQALTPRPVGVAQFTGLMQVIGVPDLNARQIAQAAGDWLDGDLSAVSGGAEDSEYAGSGQSYRTGNTFFADVSELRTVSGMTPEIYAQLRPWICALPSSELSPININTLSIEQAPLLAMLAPEQISLDQARNAISQRPATGWSSVSDLYRVPAMASVQLPVELQLQPQVRTKWFSLDLRVELQGAELVETALVDARITPAKIAARRWGIDE
jgi:general secretion pathway protein K